MVLVVEVEVEEVEELKVAAFGPCDVDDPRVRTSLASRSNSWLTVTAATEVIFCRWCKNKTS